jgi:hypothetical protein
LAQGLLDYFHAQHSECTIMRNISPDMIQASQRGYFLEVPWADAEALQTHFRGLGFGSIIHLDPAERQARLELLTNLRVEHIRELLQAASLPKRFQHVCQTISEGGLRASA